MQNLLKNKLFIILILFIILTFSIIGSSFASDGYVFSDGNTYPVPYFSLDENSNYIIYRNIDDNTTTVVIYPDIFKLIKNQQGTSYCFNLYDSSNNMITDNLMHFLKYDSSLSLLKDYYSGGIAYQDYHVYYSNVDILDTEGNLVFQVAPQGTQLSQIVEQKEMEKTMAEIVAIIPVVLVVVVALMAIRKAMKFLKRILNQA